MRHVNYFRDYMFSRCLQTYTKTSNQHGPDVRVREISKSNGCELTQHDPLIVWNTLTRYYCVFQSNLHAIDAIVILTHRMGGFMKPKFSLCHGINNFWCPCSVSTLCKRSMRTHSNKQNRLQRVLLSWWFLFIIEIFSPLGNHTCVSRKPNEMIHLLQKKRHQLS